MLSFQIKNFKLKIINWWPIITYALLVVVIASTNYKPGTFLTGWDNLHPEYDFGINIKSSLIAVWQEYQGLGLLGGMAHAADLPHQLFLLLLSAIVPLNLLRYTYVFLMLFLGATGAYLLIRFVFSQTTKHSTLGFTTQNDEQTLHQPSTKNYHLPAFLCGLFYLLNLATIQMFYVPYEAFITHFASIPWILLAIESFWKNPQPKTLIFLSVVLFVSGPAFYLPTLFVVTMIMLAIILSFLTLLDFSFASVKKGLSIIGVVVATQSYWLLSFFYFTLTNAQVNVNSKMNQMATEFIFSQNKEFGTLFDVMHLKGFWLNNIDPNRQGDFVYMFEAWRMHLENPLITGVGFLCFGIIVLGFLYSIIKRRNPLLLGFAALFAFGFTMLTTATPPFSYFNDIFREIPLFNQAFRFPFTKFSILTSLSYSVFFAIGTFLIMETLGSFKKKFLTIGACLLLITCIILQAFPVFSGHLFYEKERLTVPGEYFELFKFFKNQDKSTRIANFPQHTFWGWNFYTWGYGGSGFLWHGIEQPILDRAFDVWSSYSENYYFEVSNAIYAKNPALLEQVFNKYQIQWIILDKNIKDPFSSRATFVPELRTMLNDIENIKLVKRIGNIEIYSFTPSDNPKKFIYFTSSLPSINSYEWLDYDKAYASYGNYISNISSENSYPLRSLFSKKSQADNAFSMSQKDNQIIFSTTVSPSAGLNKLKIPSLLEEPILPVEAYSKSSSNGIRTIGIMVKTPTILLGNRKLYGYSQDFPLFTIPKNAKYPFSLTINDQTSFSIDNSDKMLGTSFLVTQNDNFVVLSDSTNSVVPQTISKSQLASLPFLAEQQMAFIGIKEHEILTVSVPKIEDTYLSYHMKPTSNSQVRNCNLFPQKNDSFSITSQNTPKALILGSKNTNACIVFYNEKLYHDIGYALFVETQNIKGRGLHFWILNEDEKYSPLATYLPSDGRKATSYFVIPPMQPHGRGYSFHFENISIGHEEVENELLDASAYPLPYRFLTGILLEEESLIPATTIHLDSEISHPNTSLYKVAIKNQDPQVKMMILSQAYDSGWKAYTIENSELRIQSWINSTFPFFFGKELKEHVKVNNWSNGWKIDTSQLSTLNSQFVIIYFPQYLQYLGYIIIVSFIIFLAYWFKTHTHTIKHSDNHL